MAKQKRHSAEQHRDRPTLPDTPPLGSTPPRRRVSWFMRSRAKSMSGVEPATKPGTFTAIPSFADSWRSKRRKPSA